MGDRAPYRRVYGVDFSGGARAGRKIWVTSARADGSLLRVAACRRGDELPGSGPGRETCLAALRDLVARERDAAFGCDFPFGLPEPLVEAPTWNEFVRRFSCRYERRSAEEFRVDCCQQSGGGDLRRCTDREARTPFAAYNLRLYRQTFHGIRDVLAPLVEAGDAWVAPLQAPQPDRAVILEVCPASTLKAAGQYAPYKGSTEARRARRVTILRWLAARGVELADETIAPHLLADDEGDALDSLVAAFATWRTVSSGPVAAWANRPGYEREGYVYV